MAAYLLATVHSDFTVIFLGTDSMVKVGFVLPSWTKWIAQTEPYKFDMALFTDLKKGKK